MGIDCGCFCTYGDKNRGTISKADTREVVCFLYRIGMKGRRVILIEYNSANNVLTMNYFLKYKKKSVTAKLLISLGILVATPGFEPGTPSL